MSIVATRLAGGPKNKAQVLRTRRAGEVFVRAVEVGLLGVWAEGGGELERNEEDEDGEGARRWRRRSVASEGVSTGSVDQDVAVETEVVERAGEEAVKVAHVVSVVEVDGDAVAPWVEGVSSMEFGRVGCSNTVVVGGASSVDFVAPAAACSDGFSGESVSSVVSSVSGRVSGIASLETCDLSSSDSLLTCSTMIKGSKWLGCLFSSATIATGLTGVELDCWSFVMSS